MIISETLLTISHIKSKSDAMATKGFKVMKMNLDDFVDFNCDVDWHYSSIQWTDGYRKSDNYISYEDFIIFDIDDGMTIETAKKHFSKYNAVIMPTKSHQKNKNGLVCDRFRVIVPFIEPLKETSEMARLIKLEIYKEVGADEQVASSSTKFRGSPLEHDVIYTNGTELFDWKKYKSIVSIEQQKKRYEQEARRLQGNDFSDLDDQSKIKAMETKFNSIYSDGNRNNAVANIILFGKSMALDFTIIERVILSLVETNPSPLPEKEVLQILKYHQKRN